MTMRAKTILLAALLLLPHFVCAEETPAHELPKGFCYVHEVIEDVILDIRYAGTHNFVGDVIEGYEAPYAILTVEAAEKLGIGSTEYDLAEI